ESQGLALERLDELARLLDERIPKLGLGGDLDRLAGDVGRRGLGGHPGRGGPPPGGAGGPGDAGPGRGPRPAQGRGCRGRARRRVLGDRAGAALEIEGVLELLGLARDLGLADEEGRALQAVEELAELAAGAEGRLGRGRAQLFDETAGLALELLDLLEEEGV